MSRLLRQSFSEAANLVQSASSIVVFSGAGLSRASGIPTYRDVNGLWQNPDNLKYSHFEAYRANPDAFVEFWKPCVTAVLNAFPNAAHYALKSLQEHKPETTFITQNVDGLLQKAACKNVIELHGSLQRSRCPVCGLVSARIHKRCLRCGGDMRPDVVFFGETVDEFCLRKAESVAAATNLMIVVGTTAEVYPAASLPIIALNNEAHLIVVDTLETGLDGLADVVLRGQAEEILPTLLLKSF
jgi:NAD-dependent deacetylase